VAAQYYYATAAHSAHDKSFYDSALARVQPIMLLSYPAVSDLSVATDELWMETSLSCVRIREVRKGSRGASSASKSSVALGGIAGGVFFILVFLQL